MKNLVTKLVEILKAVDSKVEKSGFNDHQNYAYVMEKDLLDSVRKDIAEKGIFIFSSTEEVHHEGKLTTIKVKNTFVDSESGETFEVYSAGQGADGQDKGVYKAITGAYKYFLMKNFMLAGDEDPEKTPKTAKPNKGNYKPKTKSSTSKSGGFSKSGGGGFGNKSSGFGKKASASIPKATATKEEPKTETTSETPKAEDIPFM